MYTMMMAPMMMSATPTTPSTPLKSTSLPVRTIPGSYGWPFLGPLSDRLDYFWFQGPEKFFRNRLEKHKSTVFRTNVPPTFPFISVNPNVVAVLDVKAFTHLFDMEIVEKANVLVGDFMPSVDYTGGIRVCPYLDTSEPKHSQIKNFSIDILKRSSSIWVPTVVSKLDTMWNEIELELPKSGSAAYQVPIQKFLFSFLTRCIIGADPEISPELSSNGYAMLDAWLGLQLLPTIKIGILQPLEEIFLHSFRYPFFLVQGNYNKLVEFVKTQGKEAVQIGEKQFNLTTDETIHNLLFILGFNAFGGFSIFIPSLLSKLETETESDTNKGLVAKLRDEVRLHCGKDPSNLTFENLKKMENVQSFVYETLRLNPPVPSQYARARKDFKLNSHENVYEIKKGELLCGYQPLVMRDSKVFDNPEDFVADRFTGVKGKELLNYLYWSNGPQTGAPGENNKQCAATEIVPLTGALFLAYLFQRYDSVTFSSGAISSAVKAN